MKSVIVIGGNHHNTLSVLRALGESIHYNVLGTASIIGGGNSLYISLIVVCNERNPYVKRSKYANTFEQVKCEEELLDILLTKYVSEEKPIIIACSDAIASFLDMNRDILCQRFIIPGSKTQGKITALMDKGMMAKLAVESGLKVPNSIEVAVCDINTAFSNTLTYPCITKPLVSKNGSKSDIHIFYSSQEFKRSYKELKSERIQIQTFIEKKLEYQLIGCSLNGGETVIIPGASVILRQPQNTNTGFLKYIPEFEADIDSCKRFLKSADFSGLFSMEFLRGKDGTDYFMETNFRNDGNAICVTASGMNLPYIWVTANAGEDPSIYINSCKMREVLVMPEFNDFKNVLNRSISPFQWFSDVYHTDRFMEFSKHDQKPFWTYIAKKISSIFR